MARKDDAKRRFNGYVRLAAMDKPFISRAEERRLLEDGISRFELSPDDARGVLLAVAHEHDIRVERDIDNRIASILERYGGRRRKISRKKFAEAAAIYNGLSGGMFSEEEASLRVKRAMEENGFRPRRGGVTFSRRWYRRIGRKKRKPDPLADLTGPGQGRA
jgi:hypothetical protein